MPGTATTRTKRGLPFPVQKLTFAQWKSQVGKALNDICAYGLTLQDVPQSFDFQKRYDAGVGIEDAAADALTAIEQEERARQESEEF
jgi:hypothetical protein